MRVNIEFKARANDIKELEARLLQLSPIFIGEDHQTDTYFNVSKGRLKLREGNIEHALIFYERTDASDAKQSDVLLYTHQPGEGLKEILTMVHGVKVVVDKHRKIYFVDNVKIHFDEVPGLGTFVEVEAIDKTGTADLNVLKTQCASFAKLFQIAQEDYVACSYSDMIMEKVMGKK